MITVGVDDGVRAASGVFVSGGISVEEGDGVGLIVPRTGVKVMVSGLGLQVGDGDAQAVAVGANVGGERSSHPGEGEVLSRQSPA